MNQSFPKHRLQILFISNCLGLPTYACTTIWHATRLWQMGDCAQCSNGKFLIHYSHTLELLQSCTKPLLSLQWCHNEHDGVSKHLLLDCILNRLFRRRSKKTSKLCVTGLCEGNSPVNSPHKGPVTRKMFPLVMSSCCLWTIHACVSEYPLQPNWL